MKYAVLSIFVFLFVSTSTAQSTYESPHVKDGKMLQLIIPAGYEIDKNTGSDQSTVYTSISSGLGEDQLGLESMSIEMIKVSHFSSKDWTLEKFKENLEQKGETWETGTEIIEKPVITEINGRDCLFTKIKVEDKGTTIRMYSSISRFGDYFIGVDYFSSVKHENFLQYAAFKAIMYSWKEVLTNKEDGIDLNALDIFDYDGDYELGYQNDLFETEMSYMDVLPDFNENWNESSDGSSHLLSEFIYKEDSGWVKVFSGGLASNYPSDAEMLDAIRLVMDSKSRGSIKYESKFSNDDHVFKLYSIKLDGIFMSFCTTLVNSEILFFILDEGDNPHPEFKSAARDFVLTMLLD